MKRIDLDQLVRSIDSKDIIEIGAEKIHDIAIIGMSVVLPQAKDVGEYWEMLKNGRDCISDLPPHRKSEADAYLRDLGRKVEEVRYKRGSYLERIDEFDCRFFNISPREAGLMDPNQRLFLENVWSAIEDAGYGGDKLKGSRTGVYCGFVADLGYQRLIAAIEPTEVGNSIPGNMAAIIPGRVSYFLDLKGPSVLLDTACSSSLVAIHAACQGIRNGDCEMAIAGSVKINLLPLEDDNMLGIESKNYICRAFDDDADGTCMGEGVLAIILKPLNKAVQDKDHIYAVIKGSAINQDGATMGITAPNAMAQAEVIEKAWSDAGVDPETITYIEAHGTGTKLGDPIEIDGINRAFSKYTAKKRFCAIGSVKTNLGHLDSAAGMAGLIKAVLALEHKQIPASLNFKKPNRNIDFENSPVFVNDQLIDWQTDGFPRRCGISAFGLSGTNSHIVLEEAPPASEQSQEIDTSLQIFTLSAKSETVLKKLVARYTNHLATRPEINLKDLCYTANTGRGHYRNRLAIIAATLEELTEKITYLNQTGLISNESKDIYYREVKLSPQTNEIDSETVGEGEINRITVLAGDIVSQLSKSRNRLELLKELSRLYIQGAKIQWENAYPGDIYRKVSLPAYSFEKRRRWVDLPSPVKTEKKKYLESEGFTELPRLEENPEKESGVFKVSLTGKNEGAYSKLERQIAEAWGEILGFEEINIHDDFFDLGGDSISAVRIVEIFKESNLDISVSDILTYKSVHQLAANIKPDLQGTSETSSSDATQAEVSVKEYNLFYNLKDFQTYQVDTTDHKELKIVLQNEITTYLCHSLPLCVVLADERLLPWFYEHYINIYSMIDDGGYLKLEFLEYRAPYKEMMHEVCLGYHFLEKETSIIDFIIDKINRGYYVIIHADEYFLPVKPSYQKEHFVHHSIIYGYDNTNRKLIAIGFNTEQLLSQITFDYDDFITAFENGKLYYQISAPWASNNAVELLKLKDYPGRYPFDINHFLNQLEAYLASAGDQSVIFSYMMDQKKIKYGLSVYDEIIKHLEKLLTGVFSIDYRAVHLLTEHKRGMLNRLRFIQGEYQIHGGFEEMLRDYSQQVVEQVDSIRRKFLDVSYSVSNQTELTAIPVIINEAIESIKTIKTAEQKILRNIEQKLRVEFIR
jgi:3-oxoacyl-(acyl-carrier-protein) synthase/acyl carrier protein